MDMKIFVDTADDIRLIRRLQRDTEERARTMNSVIEQYHKTVRPMHALYVEPSKGKADIIVPTCDGIQDVALDMILSRLKEIVGKEAYK
jgi:uridine kinase